MRNINKLYFGITVLNANKNKLESYNLFNFSRVKDSVAKYVLLPARDKNKVDGLKFCFGDTWSRCEFEYMVYPWPETEHDGGIKVDVFTAYVRPNSEYLMKLVNSVSKTSASRYLKENYG